MENPKDAINFYLDKQEILFPKKYVACQYSRLKDAKFLISQIVTRASDRDFTVSY